MIFAYCRVSTLEQITQNQVLEIEKAGFSIDEIVNEYCSGSLSIKSRKGFSVMLEKLRADDTLVVTKIDRLGRNIIDVKQTIDLLTLKGVKVYCLALQGIDLTSSSGALIVSLLGAIAEFEKDLIVERTKAGLKRAKAQGKKLGRPSKLNNQQKTEINHALENKISINSLAKKYSVSRKTIMNIRNKHCNLEQFEQKA